MRRPGKTRELRREVGNNDPTKSEPFGEKKEKPLRARACKGRRTSLGSHGGRETTSKRVFGDDAGKRGNEEVETRLR